MRFSAIIAGVFAVATIVLSSPVTTSNLFEGTCGYVNDNTTKEYKLENRGWGEPHEIGAKHNGYYPMAKTFHVNDGCICKFYSEATRGIGYLIGQYNGPSDDNFGDHWAAFYECWKIMKGNDIISDPIDITVRQAPEALPLVKNVSPPCGYVNHSKGGQYSLYESGKGKMQNFGINGESYIVIWYRVSSHCECRFYSSLTTRGGPELIKQAKGIAEGYFSDRKNASRYDCWVNI